MTNSTKIKLVTIGMMLAGVVLTVGDKLIPVPGLPPSVVQLWPFVYMAAGLFEKVAHILWPDVPVPPTQAQRAIVATSPK